MSGTTSVPEPTFGDTGFIAPSEADILTGVQADISAAFGGNLNTALETPQGQLASSQTAIIGDKNDQFLQYVNMVDPAYSSGRMQDAIGRIYFIERNPAQPTVAQVACTGLSGVTISVGALIQAADGNTYSCTEAGTIPDSGTITLPFSCSVTGAIACPAQTFTIYQAITGWDTAISSAAGAEGNAVESRGAFEARRAASVALNAQGSVDAVRGAVLSVADVLDAYVQHNPAGTAQSIGSVSLLPHSLYACVLGGNAQAIGEAIWSKVSPGCDFNGDTTVTVQDTSYSSPYPTYAIKYQSPILVPVKFVVTLASSTTVPADALSRLQPVIMSAFAGGDGGTRERIGGTIYASRYYAVVAALGTWARIVSITVDIGGGPADALALEINEAPIISADNITLALV